MTRGPSPCARVAGILLALLLWSVPSAAPAASRVLPGLAFRVIRTAHFRIYYHRGSERQARALAEIAESVRESLSGTLGLPAPGLTHVLLVDQDDEANGWATPWPYDTVMITAAWPAPSEIIGNTRDWVRLVFTHEYTHVLHLHQSRGWSRLARAVFGRAPFAFPNLFLPRWEIEGLATFAETRHTGEGRLNAGDSTAIVRQRVREAGPQPIDTVAGGQVSWPAGLGPYLDGGFFASYLAARYGERKLGEVARRSAGRLPFFGAPAFRMVYGKGLGALWKEFQASLAASGPDGARPGTRVTHRGFYVDTPRFTTDGRLVFGTRDADDLPALVVKDGRSERRVATRFPGEQFGVGQGLAFFDSSDYTASVAWQSDLYAVDLASGRTQRLTRRARLAAPDVSADGRALVCVRTAGGLRQLAVFRVTGTAVGNVRLAAMPDLSDPSGSYGSPRWSPDGTRIAAERRQVGGASDIVILDPATGQRVVVASSRTGRNLAPTWTPDGRTIVFASDRDGSSFQLYAVPAEPQPDTSSPALLLSVPGGAMAPVISPDGTRLVYVGSTAAGYDLFEVPFPDLGSDVRLEADATRTDVRGVRRQPDVAGRQPEVKGDSVARGASSDQRGSPPDEERPYRPIPTLLPRFWLPAADIVGNHLRLGASTSGVDLLGRHAFSLSALWRVEAGDHGLDGAHRGRPDLSASYVYDRWRTTLYLSGSDDTTFVAQYAGGARLGDAQRRVTKFAAGAVLPLTRARQSHLFTAAINVERSRTETMRGVRSFMRNSIQSGWAFSSAHLFGRSISPEQGVSVALTSEQVRTGLGADGTADAFTGELRGYLRFGSRHVVLAGRTALGAANGDAWVARPFYLGGPDPAGSLIDFGTGAFSLMRGYPHEAFAASHIGVANLECRVPLWRIDRGTGTWPVHLRALHGAVFTDAGQVWDHHFAWSGTKAAVGAELSMDVVLGFELPLTFSAGVAHPVGRDANRGALAYVRLGRAF